MDDPELTLLTLRKLKQEDIYNYMNDKILFYAASLKAMGKEEYLRLYCKTQVQPEYYSLYIDEYLRPKFDDLRS